MTDDSYHTVVGPRLFRYDIMPAHGAQACGAGFESTCRHLLKLSKLPNLVSQVHIGLHIQDARPKTLGRLQCIKAGSGTMEAKMPELCFR